MAEADVFLQPDLEDRVRAYAESQLLKRSEAIRLLAEAALAALEDND